MTDDIRTRIADIVQRKMDVGEGCLRYDAERTADAVIRELEAGYVLVPKSVTLVQWADEAFKGHTEGNFKHEHVTEWETDD